MNRSKQASASALAAKRSSTSKQYQMPPTPPLPTPLPVVPLKPAAAEAGVDAAGVGIPPKKRGRKPFKQSLDKIRQDDDEPQFEEDHEPVVAGPPAPRKKRGRPAMSKKVAKTRRNDDSSDNPTTTTATKVTAKVTKPAPPPVVVRPRPARRVKSEIIKYRTTDSESSTTDDDAWPAEIGGGPPPTDATTAPAVPESNAEKIEPEPAVERPKAAVAASPDLSVHSPDLSPASSDDEGSRPPAKRPAAVQRVPLQPKFGCPMCPTAFKRGGWLKQHMAKAHSESALPDATKAEVAANVAEAANTTVGNDEELIESTAPLPPIVAKQSPPPIVAKKPPPSILAKKPPPPIVVAKMSPPSILARKPPAPKSAVKPATFKHAKLDRINNRSSTSSKASADGTSDPMTELADIQLFIESALQLSSTRLPANFEQIVRHGQKLLLWMKRYTRDGQGGKELPAGALAMQRTMLLQQIKLYDAVQQLVAVKRDQLHFAFDDFVQRHGNKVLQTREASDTDSDEWPLAEDDEMEVEVPVVPEVKRYGTVEKASNGVVRQAELAIKEEKVDDGCELMGLSDDQTERLADPFSVRIRNDMGDEDEEYELVEVIEVEDEEEEVGEDGDRIEED